MDSWEDAEEDDFQPTVPAPVSVADNWEDEEDQTLIEQQAALAAMAVRAPLTPAQIEAQKKKEELEEQRLQNQIKYAKLENETSEERVIRERKQVEDADAALAEELFDKVPGGPKRSASSSSSGIAGLTLKNKEDHVNFGIMAAQKMSGSTSFCIAAFLKEVLNRDGAMLSAESLVDLAATIQKLQASKKVADDLSKKNTKDKKKQKATAKKHADVFGGEYDQAAEYEDFSNMEDDFM